MQDLDALAIGLAAMRLGAGRARKEDTISFGAGIECLRRPGRRGGGGRAGPQTPRRRPEARFDDARENSWPRPSPSAPEAARRSPTSSSNASPRASGYRGVGVVEAATEKLWAKQDQHGGERLRLFSVVAQAVGASGVLYPGSFVDVAASFVFPSVTYIDTDRRAAQFFGDVAGVGDIISASQTGPWRAHLLRIVSS